MTDSSKTPKMKLSEVKHLVVGVDFSEESKQLFAEARWLAAHMKADVVLVYVENLNPYIDLNFVRVESSTESLAAEAKRFYELEKFPGVTFESRFGYPDLELEDLAKDKKNALIVIGHSSKSKLEKLFTGSASRLLATRSHVPVLIY